MVATVEMLYTSAGTRIHSLRPAKAYAPTMNSGSCAKTSTYMSDRNHGGRALTCAHRHPSQRCVHVVHGNAPVDDGCMHGWPVSDYTRASCSTALPSCDAIHPSSYMFWQGG